MTGEHPSNLTAPTLYVDANGQRYAYRRFGKGPARPLLLLQHFPLARGREVVLFDNAGVGGSTGAVPTTIAEMAQHVLSFLTALKIESCDILGFSLGGMIAQQVARDRHSVVRKMILVGTAPRGGEDIMHLQKPSLAKYFSDPSLAGLALLQKIFFAPTESSQAAGAEFIARLAQRKEDRDPVSGPQVARAQLAAFREWEHFEGERFADLKQIRQPTLVVNGIHDQMIPVANSYWLSQNLPDAVLLTYPDSGHGSLFQLHESFTRQAAAFLDSKSVVAPY
jgi:pimeloyl-ACP methyl ester carboxylesterase